MSQSGARQWRIRCPCAEPCDSKKEHRMGSEVSRNNISFFPEEDRVGEVVDEADLRQWLARAEENGRSLVVCNNCRRVITTGDGSGPTTLAGPAPRWEGQPT